MVLKPVHNISRNTNSSTGLVQRGSRLVRVSFDKSELEIYVQKDTTPLPPPPIVDLLFSENVVY